VVVVVAVAWRWIGAGLRLLHKACKVRSWRC
jgi:hypothetical protein